jgi:outer membrane protein assembly factor BamD
MRKLILFLTPCLFLSLLPQTKADIVYRPDEGWNYDKPGEETPAAKTAQEQLDRAQAFENKGDIPKAIGAYRVFVKKFSYSSHLAEVQWKIATLSEKIGDDEHAFDAYDVYIKKYPRGEYFDKAVDAQFTIANRFLDGEKVKYYGIKTTASMPRAQKMFETIIANASYSKYAPLSQFNVGQALEKQEKFKEAIDAYQVVQSKYPNDPIAADAQYQIGYVYMKQSRSEGVYDPGAGSKSRDAFEDFIARYPSSEKVPQAEENMKMLSGRETKGAFEIAKYYDKQKKYKAAVIYYNDVIQQQPGSPESVIAKARIEALKSQVGEDVLQAGPERTETGERAQKSRKLQAQVDTSSRPDYVGPPVTAPVEVAPPKPALRTSSDDLTPPAQGGATPAPQVPPVEPPLPAQ